MRKMSNSDKKLIKPSTNDCLNIANNLITSCHLLVPQVNDVSEINSNLIVLLYEKITGSSVPDLMSDEVQGAHNIQSVINALSLDILQLSLSHISGEAVVRGDTLAVFNLLHILENILLHSYNREQTIPRRKIKRLKTRKSEMTNGRICPLNTLSSQLDVERIFEKNVELKLHTTIMKESHSLKCKPFLKERNHLQSSQSLYKSTHPRPCHKSFLLPYTLRKKYSSHPSLKKDSKPKNKSSEKEVKRSHEIKGYHHATHFIQELLDEFPCIHISPSLLKNVENMYAHQLVRMHALMKKCLLEKSRAAIEAENISKRQLKLAEILKKDMLQQKHLNKVKEATENGRRINYCLRDSRIKSAKMKQYSDEFVLEMRRKMLSAANNAEELLFKRVFKEIMDIQNEHVNDLCQQMREARMEDDRNYLTYLNSLENLYQSQYLALSEEIANERNETQLRQSAEREALSKIEREFKKKLKNEIRFMQRVIVEQTGDCHFREMDANLYIDERRRR